MAVRPGMLALSVTVQAKQIRQQFQKIPDQIGDRIDYALVAQRLLKRVRERMRRGIGADGQPHTQLAASTLKRRRRKGVTSVTPLMASQQLYRSVQASNLTTLRPGATKLATGFGFALFADAQNAQGFPYGRAHQRGLGVPRRGFLDLGRLDLASVRDMIQKMVIGQRVRP